jgi:dienelactone hydrolase
MLLQPESTADAAIEDIVRERFDAAGFDVWLPRGRAGLCDWDEAVRSAECWPSDERHIQDAADIMGEWRAALAGRRPLVVGFSNGAAFAVLLAVHGLLDACAFVALHGVPAGSLRRTKDARPTPILFVGARGASWEADQIASAERALSLSGWPHQSAMREGLHGVTIEDLDLAVDFARRARCR